MAQMEVSEVIVVAGLGCRADCAARDVVGALSSASQQYYINTIYISELYAPEPKSTEAGLLEAAAALGKPLLWLSLDLLRARSAEALTHSPRVQALLGVPSVAETAALAGAHLRMQREPHQHGAQARLLGPRISLGGATCALASLTLTHGAPWLFTSSARAPEPPT